MTGRRIEFTNRQAFLCSDCTDIILKQVVFVVMLISHGGLYVFFHEQRIVQLGLL